MGWDRIIGEGRGNLSEERFPLPSPNPSSLLPKTFDFIESLFPAFPVGKKKSLNNAFRLFVVERVLLKR